MLSINEHKREIERYLHTFLESVINPLALGISKTGEPSFNGSFSRINSSTFFKCCKWQIEIKGNMSKRNKQTLKRQNYWFSCSSTFLSLLFFPIVLELALKVEYKS